MQRIEGYNISIGKQVALAMFRSAEQNERRRRMPPRRSPCGPLPGQCRRGARR